MWIGILSSFAAAGAGPAAVGAVATTASPRPATNDAVNAKTPKRLLSALVDML
jgi:hypothetical protein